MDDDLSDVIETADILNDPDAMRAIVEAISEPREAVYTRKVYQTTVHAHPDRSPTGRSDFTIYERMSDRAGHWRLAFGALVISPLGLEEETVIAPGLWGSLSHRPGTVESKGQPLSEEDFRAMIDLANERSVTQIERNIADARAKHEADVKIGEDFLSVITREQPRKRGRLFRR